MCVSYMLADPFYILKLFYRIQFNRLKLINEEKIMFLTKHTTN